jgi:ribonuclease J
MDAVTLTKPRVQVKKIDEISRNALKVIPLGGLGEYGKNMMVYQYNEDIIIVDAGFMFPNEEMLGIDFVIPDVRYLEENKHKIKGLIITHAHEDHMGGIPYLLRKLDIPIWTTKLAAGMIEVKLEEFNIKPKINLIKDEDKIKLGVFDIEFIRVNHSIPDCVSLAIDTPEGVVMHVTDFKFDFTPINEDPIDLQRIAGYGKRNVLLLLSDSTNAEIPGYTASEQLVGETLDKIISQAQGRVLITSFASLINRIQHVFNSAVKHKRKVALSGRSMIKNVEIATKLGYLKIPQDSLINIREVKKIPENQVIILATGSQGEERSAMVMMASGQHNEIQIQAGDTVIVSASMVPGNERSAYNTINNLYKLGADVYYGKSNSLLNIHTSGHAAQEELKMLINMVKPEYFIPLHGEYRSLFAHAKLARDVGVEANKIFIIENGQQVEFRAGAGKIAQGRVPAGYVLVDGLGVGDVGNIVLRDRQAMAKDGILVAIVTVDAQNGKLLSSPDIISRGFIYMREREDLVFKIRENIKNLLNKYTSFNKDWATVKTLLREDLSEFLYKETQRRPMVIPVVIEI